MRPTVCLILATTLISTVAACGGKATQDAQPAPSSAGLSEAWFGINGQYLRPLVQQPGGSEALDSQLESISQLGVDFVRINFDWRVIQPTAAPAGAPSYDWRELDTLVGAMAEHRLRWAVLGQGAPTPSWAANPDDLAQCGSRAKPVGTEPFARLMAAVAERYGRDGAFWAENPDTKYLPVTDYEVWNEPNHASFWCPQPDPAEYARLYEEARSAVHRVDPDALVTIGGIAPFPPSDDPLRMGFEEFLDGVSDALGQAPVDGVAIHAYGPDPAAVVGLIGAYRQTLDAIGFESVPMILNEVGWPTAGTGGPVPLAEVTRAASLRTLSEGVGRLAENCKVIRFAPHTWISPEVDPSSAESWYGVADPVSAAVYPSGEAIGSAYAALRGDSSGESSVIELPAVC